MMMMVKQDMQMAMSDKTEPKRASRNLRYSPLKRCEACNNCHRSKVRCIGPPDAIPCSTCVKRNMAGSCRRASRRVRSSTAVSSSFRPSPSVVSTAVSRWEANQGEEPIALAAINEEVTCWLADMEEVIRNLPKLSGAGAGTSAEIGDIGGAAARFAWFCSMLCSITGKGEQEVKGDDVMQGHREVLLGALLRARELIQSISGLVFAATIPASFGQQAANARHQLLQVELEMFKFFPMAVIVLGLRPRPFSPDAHPAFINAQASRMLGYSEHEFASLLMEPSQLLRLLPGVGCKKAISILVKTVKKKEEHCTIPGPWRHKNGKILPLLCTVWIKYQDHLPAEALFFIQEDPSKHGLPSDPMLPIRMATGQLSAKLQSLSGDETAAFRDLRLAVKAEKASSHLPLYSAPSANLHELESKQCTNDSNASANSQYGVLDLPPTDASMDLPGDRVQSSIDSFSPMPTQRTLISSSHVGLPDSFGGDLAMDTKFVALRSPPPTPREYGLDMRPFSPRGPYVAEDSEPSFSYFPSALQSPNCSIASWSQAQPIDSSCPAPQTPQSNNSPTEKGHYSMDLDMEFAVAENSKQLYEKYGGDSAYVTYGTNGLVVDIEPVVEMGMELRCDRNANPSFTFDVDGFLRHQDLDLVGQNDVAA